MSGQRETVFVCPLCQRTSVVHCDLHGRRWDCRECGQTILVLIPGVPRPAFLHVSSRPPEHQPPASPFGAIDEHEPRKPLPSRLASFLDITEEELVSREPVMEASRMTLHSAAKIGSGRPPKTGWHFRQILERIRRLVHGRTTNEMLAIPWSVLFKRRKV